MIKESPRRGGEDFDASSQQLRLGTNIDAAINDARAQRRVFRIGSEVFRHLVGELARRRKHKRTHRMARRRHRGVGLRENSLNQRKAEAGGLPGAGLRRPHHVAAHQNNRNSLLLNRRGRRVAHAFNGGKNAGIKTELFEGRHPKIQEGEKKAREKSTAWSS